MCLRTVGDLASVIRKPQPEGRTDVGPVTLAWFQMKSLLFSRGHLSSEVNVTSRQMFPCVRELELNQSEVKLPHYLGSGSGGRTV